MREIKFRQWTGKGFFFWGFLGNRFDGITTGGGISLTNALENSQQFTGLHDKNGTEIYEGDIVRDTDSGEAGKVVYIISGNGLESACFTTIFDAKSQWGFVPNKKGQDNHCEVIGNIYQNKDLLK